MKRSLFINTANTVWFLRPDNFLHFTTVLQRPKFPGLFHVFQACGYCEHWQNALSQLSAVFHITGTDVEWFVNTKHRCGQRVLLEDSRLWQQCAAKDNRLTLQQMLRLTDRVFMRHLTHWNLMASQLENPSAQAQTHAHMGRQTHLPLRRCVNFSRRQHLRNALFDALHQLSGTHYRKLFSVVTLLQFLSLG